MLCWVGNDQPMKMKETSRGQDKKLGVNNYQNYGNVDGDGPAHQRYTETRLSKIATEMLRDIKKDSVDMKLNFSEDEYEPCVLPSKVPNLLVNGTVGIGVALACSFAPHNLTEVIKGAKAQLLNPDISIEDLHNLILAPDFPGGGLIINQKEILDAYKTGKGKVRIRGKYTIEKHNKKDVLVFHELPYGVSKEPLITSIAELAEQKKIEGISDIRDSSNKNGIRLEIEVKKGINADVVANHLFRLSRLEDTFSINQVCLVNREPKLLNLKGVLQEYLNHQVDVITRRTKFDLQRINERLHIVEGLLKALENIDNVINTIKTSANPNAAIEGLMKQYGLTEEQSKAIVDMKLRRLTGLESIELQAENKELVEKSRELGSILSNREKLNEVLICEMDELVSTYGDSRRTEITNINPKSEEKDIELVQPEEVVVVATQDGSIKKIPAKSFRVQSRNGKGIKNQEDIVMDVIKTNTIDNLMIFTSLGKMYRLVVDQIPTGTNSSRGVSAHTLVKMEAHEKVIAISSIKRDTSAEYVVFISQLGMIKKTRIDEYTKAKRSGIAAVGLREDDRIADIVFTNEEDMILVSKMGMSIRFKTNSITPVGRTAIGVRAMKLSEDDIVVSALPITTLDSSLAIFTSNGLAKKTNIKEYPTQGRDGRGTITYKPTQSTGTIVGAVLLQDKDNVLLTGDQTSICISAKDIPSLGKASIGNMMMKENTVMSITKI